jgi:hypothetical protein
MVLSLWLPLQFLHRREFISSDPDDLGESPVMDCLEVFGAAVRCLKSNANPVDLLIGCANYRQREADDIRRYEGTPIRRKMSNSRNLSIAHLKLQKEHPGTASTS